MRLSNSGAKLRVFWDIRKFLAKKFPIIYVSYV